MSEIDDLIDAGRSIENAVQVKDWVAKDRPGAGLEIHGVLPKGFNFRGVDHAADGETAFQIWSLPNHQNVLVACERWVQFETGEWKVMQAANAKRIEFACNNHDKYLRLLEMIVPKAEVKPRAIEKNDVVRIVNLDGNDGFDKSFIGLVLPVDDVVNGRLWFRMDDVSVSFDPSNVELFRAKCPECGAARIEKKAGGA